MAHRRTLRSKRKLLKTWSNKRRRRRTIRKMRGGENEDNAKRMIELLSEYQDTGYAEYNESAKRFELTKRINELNSYFKSTTTPISKYTVSIDGPNLKADDSEFSCSITVFNNVLPKNIEDKILTTDEYNAKRMIKLLSQYHATGDEINNGIAEKAELTKNIKALNSVSRSTTTSISRDTVSIDGTDLKTDNSQFSCSITAFNNVLPENIEDKILTTDEYDERIKIITQKKRPYFSRFWRRFI